jgi:glycerophosphoryl diester phosphodiesterase
VPRPYYLFQYSPTGGRNFTVIAHRGASAYYPENTLSSFAGAIEMDADMVELDVQLTKDGEVVVFHDEKIERCTDGRGRVAGHTLQELKRLDAGSWFSSRFTGEKIPTLIEVLDFCKNKIAVNIEIKTEAVKDDISGGIEDKCLQIVERNGMKDHVIFSSFDPRALVHLKQIENSIPTAVLFEKKYFGSRLPSDIIASLDADAFNCSLREFSGRRRADLQSNDIPVNIYTVDDKKNMKLLLAAGVSGIFTDCPDVLNRIVADYRQEKDSTGGD